MFAFLQRVVFVTVLTLSFSSLGLADQKDLSGTWVPIKEKSDSLSRQAGQSGMGGLTLTISKRAEELIFVRRGGQSRNRRVVLKPGAGPMEVTGQGTTGALEVVWEARWEGDTLVVDRTQMISSQRGQGQLKQEQRYQLSADGNTLTQKVKTNRQGRDSQFTVVYDRQ